MPKIIDHEAYRLELATKAVDVFMAHGYHGLGMRGIAEAIGVSKSALYHYFPSKQELFAASTEIITQPEAISGKPPADDAGMTRHDALIAMLRQLDGRFQGEIALLLDYMRGKSPAEIAKDPLMELANRRYLQEMINLVGEEVGKEAFAMALGGLLMRLLDGKQTETEDIASWVMTYADANQSRT